MSKEKKHPVGLRILRFISMMPLMYRVARNFMGLVEDEAAEVIRKAVILLIALIFCVILMSTVWLVLQFMIVIYLLSLHLSAMKGVFIVLILNCLLLVITALIMLNVKKRMFFPKTKQLLTSILKQD